MPSGRVHHAHSLRMARLLGLRVPGEAHSMVNRIIDEPRRVPGMLWERLRARCPRLYMRLSWALEAGMRARGIMAHDWRSPAGRRLLYEIVECLYGGDARLLVDLHLALDDVWEGRDPATGGYDPRVLHYLRLAGLL